MIDALFQKRESCFTWPRCFGGCVAYVVVGVVIIVMFEVFGGELLPNWAWGIAAAVIVTFGLAWVWPSYRIAACGVTVFLWGGLFCSVAPLLHYYGLELFFEALPKIALVNLVALIWLSACVTVARLRLPIVYPPGRCQSCGYDLSGLDRSRCPECGSSIMMSTRYPSG